jgi:uncharacterized LabA/DUF88 family protein
MGISHGPPRGCDPGGFVFSGGNVNRVVFLVDGLNLYHSLREAQIRVRRRLTDLDVVSFCRSYLHALPGNATLQGTHYFSALAHHLESRHPGQVAGQLAYFSALESTGVSVHLGQFKAVQMRCPICHSEYIRWEEKETDVSIGAALLSLVCRDACDTVVLVTGDTDLLPAMWAARELDSTKRLAVMLPYRRFNKELRDTADAAFLVRANAYARHQLLH